MAPCGLRSFLNTHDPKMANKNSHMTPNLQNWLGSRWDNLHMSWGAAQEWKAPPLKLMFFRGLKMAEGLVPRDMMSSEPRHWIVFFYIWPIGHGCARMRICAAQHLCRVLISRKKHAGPFWGFRSVVHAPEQCKSYLCFAIFSCRANRLLFDRFGNMDRALPRSITLNQL